MSVMSRAEPADLTLRFPQERKAPRPAYLSPVQLLAQYEALAAKGSSIAAERVRQLRAKLEGRA